jgi:hypothetical protein
MFDDINDVCIIITGKIIPVYINEIINTYKNIKNKIISTWIDQDSSLINTLYENGFIIVLNNYPERNATFNFQFTQMKYGILKAKELGFKYVLKFRTDTYIKNFYYEDDNIKLIKEIYSLNNENIPSNIELNNNNDKLLQFINCTKHLYNKITFISGELCNNINIHPSDLVCFGQADELLSIVYENDSNFDGMWEKVYLDIYLKKSSTTISEYKNRINSCIIECINNNIDLFWDRTFYSSQGKFFINDHLINTQIRHHKFIVF